mmetsp:Transcript_40771/g.83315  ORF Transcript_40771/g.83315 Transcript_40771/m.83315 type:complete len:626 (+) Transcript_40771:52-1929(+)
MSGRKDFGQCTSFHQGVAQLNMASQAADSLDLDAAIAAANAKILELQSQVGGLSGEDHRPQPAGAGYVEARSAGGFTPGFEPGPPLDKTQLSRLGSVAPSEVPVTPSPKASVHTPPQRSVSMAAHADTTSQSPIMIGSSGRKLTYAEQQAYFPDAQYRDETLRTPLLSSPEDTDESILKKKTMRLEDTLVDETQEVPQHPSRESEQGEPHGTARSSNTGDSEVDKSQAGETPPSSKPSPEGDMYSDGTYWKMRNYTKPNKRGVCKASESAVAMFKTEDGRKRLRDLLLQHGSFEQVEVALVKYRKEEEENTLEGGFYSAVDLANDGWNTQMIEHSRQWALQRGLVEKNEVHGEEEWRIPKKRRFKFKEQHGTEVTQRAGATFQDSTGAMFEQQIDRQALVEGDAVRNPAQQLSAASHQAAAASKQKALPVLQANQDPFGLLGAFIAAVGANISKAEEQKDRLSDLQTERATKMAKEMGDAIVEYEDLYKKLLKYQIDFTSSVPDRNAKDLLSKTYVQCTQRDMCVNNLIGRARTIKPAAKAKASAKANSEKKPLPLNRRAKSKKNLKNVAKDDDDDDDAEEDEKNEGEDDTPTRSSSSKPKGKTGKAKAVAVPKTKVVKKKKASK